MGTFSFPRKMRTMKIKLPKALRSFSRKRMIETMIRVP